MNSKQLPLLLAAGFLATLSQAQNSFSAFADIDAGNIRARSRVHGDNWHDQNGNPQCEFPKGSGKFISGASGLWMGGYDAGVNLRMAAETYGNLHDFWPGPISNMVDSAARYAESARWAKIWTVTSAEVQSFRSQTTHNLINTPAAVLGWPGHGNPHAKDEAGMPLAITVKGAPFVDVNNDGNYNALDGDYPKMMGDQMQWWLTNDAIFLHEQSQALPVEVEVAHLVYAYNRGNALDNAVYYSYEVTNKSQMDYNFFRLGFYSDPDVGFSLDDQKWMDSSRRMTVSCNATASDAVYGTTIPAVGVILAEQPGDAVNALLPYGAVVHYRNDFTLLGNPAAPAHYNNFLSAYDKGGNPVTSNWATALPCDNAAAGTDWRQVLSTRSHSLPVGATFRYSYILVACGEGGSCPSISLGCLNRIADSAMAAYWNPPPSLGLFSTVQSAARLTIFPNPASNTVYLETLDKSVEAVRVTDVAGRGYSLPQTQTGRGLELDIRSLAPGMYHLRMLDNGVLRSGSFIKE